MWIFEKKLSEILVADSHGVYVAGTLNTAIVSVYAVQTIKQVGVKRKEEFELTMYLW